MEETMKRITWLLFDSGMTQTAIAKRTGISKMTISRIRTGKQTLASMRMENIIILNNAAQEELNK